MSKDQKNKNGLLNSKILSLFIVAAVLLFSLIFFITQVMNYINARKELVTKHAEQAFSLIDADNSSEIEVCLSATSTEEDLYIVIRRDDGYAVEGEIFSLDVTYPGGNIFTFDSDKDGSCYLTDLPAGEYQVSMKPKSGYSVPDALSCQVSKHTDHIFYSDSTNILDENGNITFTYSFETDENGYLLYKKSGKPSDVILVNNKQSGEVYGLRFISPDDFLSDESTALHVERIELIHPDNTVNTSYSIQAVPAVRQDGQLRGWQLVDGDICFTDDSGKKVTGLQIIDGKKYFFDDNGVKAKSLGIDVSSFNDSINWEAAKAHGIDFAILRIGGRGWTSGLIYNDSFFYPYIQGARKAGLKLGLYFYSTAVTPDEAVEEANFTLKNLAGMPLDMPIYFDSEYSGEYPDGRADLLTISQRTDIARMFCETIEMAGYQAGVYASQNFFCTALDYLPVSQYSVWLAVYTKNLSLPTFFYDYDMWQFTEYGKVNGLSGGVDMNIIF